MLRMHYRIGAQETETQDWSSKKQHTDNWKQDKYIAILFQQVYSAALYPYKRMNFIKKDMRILEYGCSLAPYYRSYRKFYSHLNAKWTLADLRQISYLYSVYSYRNDDAIEQMIVIDENNMDNPFGNSIGEFDVIILTTVFEHLHEPIVIAKLLLSKLKSGGILMFDYLKSHATGLDSEKGLTQRQETLEYIRNNTTIVKGDLSDIEKDIPVTLVKKK